MKSGSNRNLVEFFDLFDIGSALVCVLENYIIVFNNSVVSEESPHSLCPI